VRATADRYGLSPRESKVLAAFGSGKSEKDIGQLLQMSPRTVETYLANIQRKLQVVSRSAIGGIVVKAARGVVRDEGLETPPRDEAYELTAAIDRATEVIGDRQEAMRWLGTPVRALNFTPPISLLSTPDGTRRVLEVLGQMEHGVW
jgi:DNA-binding CsgD family transcriptional regulator